MAGLSYTKGNWNNNTWQGKLLGTMGFDTSKDYGVTELLGGKTGSLGGGAKNQNFYQQVGNYVNQPSTYTPTPSAQEVVTTHNASGLGSTPQNQITTLAEPTGGTDLPSEPSFDDMYREVQRQYGDLTGNIEQQISDLGPYQQELEGNVNQSYQNQIGMVNNAQAQGEQQLANNRTEAAQTEKATLRTLSDDIRNLFQSGNQTLGSMGASDSSASEMLKYALAKQGNKRTADVVGTTRKIYSDINNLAVTLKNETNNKLLAVDQWKTEQLDGITKYIYGLKSELQNQLNNVNSAVADKNIQLITSRYQDAKNLYDSVLKQTYDMKQQLAYDYQTKQNTLATDAATWIKNAQYTGKYADSYNQVSGLNSKTPTTSNTKVGYAPATGVGQEEKSPWDELLNLG